MAGVLRCRVGDWPIGPIPCLGLKVRGRVKGTEAWKGVIDRVRGRLKRWDTKSLSLGELQ